MTLLSQHCDALELAYQFHTACAELEQVVSFARSLNEREGLQFLQLWRSEAWHELQSRFPDCPNFPKLEEDSF